MTTEEWKARMCSAQLSTFKRWQDGTSLKAPRGFWQNSLLDHSLSSTVLEHASPHVLMNWFCNDFFKSCLSWKNKSFMRLRCLLLFFGAVQFLSCVRLLWDPIDCSLPGSSVHWISQARVNKNFSLTHSLPFFQFCTVHCKTLSECFSSYTLKYYATSPVASASCKNKSEKFMGACLPLENKQLSELKLLCFSSTLHTSIGGKKRKLQTPN